MIAAVSKQEDDQMMIRSLFLAVFALILGALSVTGPAVAGDLYNHNGSLVELEWMEGDGMVIRYVQPRSGLPASVRRGTVLFSGASPADGSIYGVAYIFSRKCGRVGYEVKGRFVGDNFWIDGPAPVRNSNCRVIRHEMNRNSRLDFQAR